jgi:tetratricopeptide (TPR) repeat protein
LTTSLPGEIAIFSSRLDKKTLNTLKAAFIEFRKHNCNKEKPLTTWKSAIKKLIFTEHLMIPELFALASFIAWIQADYSFSFKLESEIKKSSISSPIFESFLGASYVESGKLAKGLEKLENGFQNSINTQDFIGSIIISGPFMLILSNLRDRETLEQIQKRIYSIFTPHLSKDPKLEPFLLPTLYYRQIKDLQKQKFDFNRLISISENVENNLFAGIAHTFSTRARIGYQKKIKHYQDAINHFEKIDAHQRLFYAKLALTRQIIELKGINDETKPFLEKIREIAFETNRVAQISYYMNYGGLLLSKGDFQGAKSAYNNLRDTYNDLQTYFHHRIESYLGLSRVYLNLDKKKNAIMNLNNCLKLIKRDVLPVNVKLSYIIQVADCFCDLGLTSNAIEILSEISENLNGYLYNYSQLIRGKIELNQQNIGSSKNYFTGVLSKTIGKKGKLLSSEEKALIIGAKIALSEAYIREYSITEEKIYLNRAEKLLIEATQKEGDWQVSEKTRGKTLLAFVYAEKFKYQKAENLLLEVQKSTKTLPRVKITTDKIIARIKSRGENSVSISNFTDVLGYLNFAKKLIKEESH